MSLLGDGSVRLCVDLLDMCWEEMGVTQCHFLVPKCGRGAMALAQFLVRTCGAAFVDDAGVDTFEWLSLCVEP